LTHACGPKRVAAAMRNRRILAVTTALSWLIAISLMAATVFAGGSSHPAGDAGPVAIPALTAAERDEAAQLATTELSALTGSSSFAVREVGVWHTHKRKKLGAVVVVAADPSRPYRATWPMIDYDRSETSEQGYRDDESRYTASRVREFLVLVDLRRGKVVQVDPSGLDVQVTDVAGDPRRRSAPRGD
jgi:hypothetical protein